LSSLTGRGRSCLAQSDGRHGHDQDGDEHTFQGQQDLQANLELRQIEHGYSMPPRFRGQRSRIRSMRVTGVRIPSEARLSVFSR
jgi:hypothetical protein